MTRFKSDSFRYVFAGALTLALCGCASSLGNFGFGGGDKSTQTASVDEALVGDPQAQQTTQGQPQPDQAGESQPQTQVSARPASRSGYCPKIEIRSGTQSFRKYAKPNEPSRNSVLWQASIGETARQCQDGPDGKLSIKIGVSGRVIAGPKGAPGDVTVPVRVAVVKFQEAVLSSELHKEKVTIGTDLTTGFSRVYQVDVPDPGGDRDYIIYVGFDDGKKN